MDNSSLPVETGFVLAFQYDTSHNLKAGLLLFTRRKFHKHSMVYGKVADCWQAPYSKIAMLKVKEDMISDCKLIFSFSWYNMYVEHLTTCYISLISGPSL